MAVGYQAVLGCEFGVLRVLIERVDPSVADGNTLQVDLGVVHELELARDIRNVVACEALTSDVDFSPLELRVLHHKVMQEVVEVI